MVKDASYTNNDVIRELKNIIRNEEKKKQQSGRNISGYGEVTIDVLKWHVNEIENSMVDCVDVE